MSAINPGEGTLSERLNGSSPFNRPAAAPELVEMWRNNLRKSQRQDQGSKQVDLPVSINIIFDAAGVALTAGQAGLVEIPFPCRILGCHMYAGVFNAVTGPQPIQATATVELRLGHTGAWSGGTQPLYGSGATASMAATPEANVSISGWNIDLQPGDLIAYSLASISGSATFLTVSIPVQRFAVTSISVSELASGSGDIYVDSAGRPLAIRG